MGNRVDVSTPASPPDLLVRFARAVARRPHAIAVEANDATLTYAELDRLSSRLAHRLCALWPGRGATQPRVGVSLPRGATELVALLAVLKAGAAYVPLDPSHPAPRVSLVLEDASPDAMIVNPESRLHDRSSPRPAIVLDGLGAIGPGSDEPLRVRPSASAIAYVMFTSGSTGRPKGVEVTRGALANFLRSMAHAPGLAHDDRLLAVTTTAFDIAGLELYLPLWVGATVIIADGATARDPRKLRQRLEQGDVTVMQATPATWRLLLDAGWQGRRDRPLRMLCGGEGMPPALADRLLATGGELWNMYGPTETTIWSSIERIDPGYDRITIGRPIDDTQMYVLDEALRPVPPGVDGELVIGGAGLARGYLGRPDLTEQRFVQHAGLGQRLYRTGDLARQLPDGRFEWRGRLDHQVKIHGFRVELGEIEARLSAVPGVSGAVVVALPRPDADPELCAYWVGSASRDALVAAARRWLPAPVVPVAWVRLERFPLNTNGKVDRKALPRPEASVGEGGPIKRPSCDAEARIAAIWRDVLRLPEVPVDRDFFTLGGSSVLAARVALRLQQETGVEVPLRVLFEATTIEQLAARLRGELGGEGPIVVQLRPGEDRRPLFCLLGVHLYQDLAQALSCDRPVIGMHVPLRPEPGGQAPSVESIAARYVALIRRHQSHGPYHLLGLCFGGIVAYAVARQLEAEGERVAMVTIIDAVLPSAVHVDAVGRLRSAVGAVARGWQEPQELMRRVDRRLEWLSARVGLRAPIDPAAGELSLDGPAVEAEVRRFCEIRGRINARLLIVRATGTPVPDWQNIDRDQGWGGRARNVRVVDVEADHLGVMREPHVRTLARALDEVLSPPTYIGTMSSFGGHASV